MEFRAFLYSLIVIFFMIICFMILFSIIFDIFPQPDMGGFAKTLWLIFIPVHPLWSMLVCVIVRGPGMAKRNQQMAEEAQKQQRSTPSSSSNRDGQPRSIRSRTLRSCSTLVQSRRPSFDQIKAKALAISVGPQRRRSPPRHCRSGDLPHCLALPLLAFHSSMHDFNGRSRCW